MICLNMINYHTNFSSTLRLGKSRLSLLLTYEKKKKKIITKKTVARTRFLLKPFQ